jgi:hypothetical protein
MNSKAVKPVLTGVGVAALIATICLMVTLIALPAVNDLYKETHSVASTKQALKKRNAVIISMFTTLVIGIVLLYATDIFAMKN